MQLPAKSKNKPEHKLGIQALAKQYPYWNDQQEQVQSYCTNSRASRLNPAREEREIAETESQGGGGPIREQVPATDQCQVW